jgi:hypothetical protein
MNTTGVRTNVNCVAPASVDLANSSTEVYTMNAVAPSAFSSLSGSNGCNVTVEYNFSSGEDQYGYGVTTASSCTAETDTRFQPVMFWFIANIAGFFDDHAWVSTKRVMPSAVFCRPTLDIMEVVATASVTNRTMLKIQESGPYTAENNITDGTLSGRVYNG